MKFSKLHIDRSPLTAADVAAGQSFQQLLKQATPKAWYQTSWFYASAGLAVVAGVVVAAMLLPNSELSESSVLPPVVQEMSVDSAHVERDQLRVIDPPFGDDKAWHTILVDAEREGSYRIGNSEVFVPAEAFHDATGNTLKGKVELRFRAFRNKVDLFMSGIPMEYDSAGTTYTFESDGMFEIRGAQNGRSVTLDPERPLGVDFDCNTGNERFGTYVFNESTGNWDFLGMPPVRKVGEELMQDTTHQRTSQAVKPKPTNLEPSIEQVSLFEQDAFIAESTSLDPQPPVKPIAANPDKFQIELAYDSTAFPELGAYANVLFEIDDAHAEEAKAARQEVWNNLSIQRNGYTDQYVLTFSRPGEEYSVQAYPVFASGDLPLAQEVFDQKYDTYQKEKAKADARREERSEALEQQARSFDPSEQFKQKSVEDRLLRRIMVGRFGIYNCDTPMPLPGNNVMAATPVNANGTRLVMNRLFLVEKERNAIWRMQSTSTINYSTAYQNLLWGVTYGGELAVCSAETFEAVASGQQEQLVFDILHTAADSPSSMRETLTDFLGSDELNVFQ